MTNLAVGNYMRCEKVLQFFEGLHKRFDLSHKIENQVPVHKGEYSSYYSTSDLKKVLEDYVFEALECEVITHMILK